MGDELTPAPGPQRPLRILMVLESEFTAKDRGGAESQVKTLARHLNALGQRVTVLTPLALDGSRRCAERIDGIPVGRLRFPRRPVLGGAVMNLRLAAFLWRHRRRYDAWHVHIGHNLGAITCLMGDLVGTPVVVKISGWWELEKGLLAPDAGLFARLGCSLLKRASTIQAISSRVENELKKRGFSAERIVLLPNAVDISRFQMRTTPRAAGVPFTALFVGRLVEEKGLTTLIDAWVQAFSGRRDVRLMLVGGGPLDATLRERAQRLGIGGQVEFLGHREHVEDMLAQAHIGVLPSRIEGLSNALLEFMACGLPTVASQVSGSEDFVITGRNGWLFPVSDVAALAAHLRSAEALSGEQLAELGRQARADVEAKAALELVVNRLLTLYRKRSA